MDTQNRTENSFLNWLFLPITLAFAVIGIGILTGFLFRDNALLDGPMRIVVGLLLLIYGIIRSVMVSRKLFAIKKGNNDG